MEDKKTSKLGAALGIASLGVIPFVAAVIQFFAKAKDENAVVKYKDLLVLLGLQAAIAAALAAKVLFFNYPVLK